MTENMVTGFKIGVILVGVFLAVGGKTAMEEAICFLAKLFGKDNTKPTTRQETNTGRMVEKR